MVFSLVAVVNGKLLGRSSCHFSGALEKEKGFPAVCCVLFCIMQGKNVYSETYLRKYLQYHSLQPKFVSELQNIQYIRCLGTAQASLAEHQTCVSDVLQG